MGIAKRKCSRAIYIWTMILRCQFHQMALCLPTRLRPRLTLFIFGFDVLQVSGQLGYVKYPAQLKVYLFPLRSFRGDQLLL
jgi:hypothetical protein